MNNSARFWRKGPVLVITLFFPLLIFVFLCCTFDWCLIRHILLWNNAGYISLQRSEIDEYYADVRYERIAILNALGAYYSYLGKIETKQREKEEHFILATQFYNKASRIDIHEPSTWVGKGRHRRLFITYYLLHMAHAGN